MDDEGIQKVHTLNPSVAASIFEMSLIESWKCSNWLITNKPKPFGAKNVATASQLLKDDYVLKSISYQATNVEWILTFDRVPKYGNGSKIHKQFWDLRLALPALT